MSSSTLLVFIIGGTGAQGLPIVEALVKDGAYAVRLLTRSSTSKRAIELAKLGSNVSFMEGSFASESTLRAGYQGCDFAFVNIDGFNTGEKGELFWDYGYKKSGYDPQFRVGHYDGKGRISEWILHQTRDNSSRMGAAIFTTGPYIDMTISRGTVMTPRVEQDEAGQEVMTWRVPLGDGAVPHVALSDCGPYVRWLFDNQHKANGTDLEVAIAHVGYEELATAFAKVTGKKARFVDVSLEQFWTDGALGLGRRFPAGYNADSKDPANMTLEDNFSGFWNLFKASGGNKGVLKRDYAQLDEIFPGRIKSAEEWFRMEDKRGREAGEGTLWERVVLATQGKGPGVLKLTEDKRKGKL